MRTEAFWSWYDLVPRPRLGVRADTFAKMFEHLDGFDRPVTIVETGCIRKVPGDEKYWDNGQSTMLFDRYCRARGDGSRIFSIDNEPGNIAIAKTMVSGDVKFICGDSIVELPWIDVVAIDLLYLDSLDASDEMMTAAATHAFGELMAATRLLNIDSMVAVDDSPSSFGFGPHMSVVGKGYLIAKHAEQVAAEVKFLGYQIGWTMMVGHDRTDVRSLITRARAHVERKFPAAAAPLYQSILELTSALDAGWKRVAHGEACAYFARAALALGKLGIAADWYRTALDVDPMATDYRMELCTRALRPMGCWTTAMAEARRGVAMAPDDPEAWHTLGGMAYEMNNLPGCIEAYDKQLEIAPADADALVDRANAAIDGGDYVTAKNMLDRLIAVAPKRSGDAWHMFAMIEYRSGCHEKAIDLYDRAVERKCSDPGQAKWNKSLALHAIGRYREGWLSEAHRVDSRMNPTLALPMKRFKLPLWDGKAEGSVHVHAEGGAGDNLCLSRYLPILAARGIDVRFECVDRMTSLMRRSLAGVTVVDRAPDYPGAWGIKPFDHHVPMLHLPCVMGTDIDTVPWTGPYLVPDPDLVAKYRKSLLPAGINVGLCWSSGIRDGIWIREYGLRKSMKLAIMVPIVDMMDRLDMSPISLQVGPERMENNGEIYDPLPASPTWDDTAAVIANLDLVITVDTAVAHLAGAMGKPVWVMCQRDGASWHWMCWRPGASWNEASPWYPHARVFRQHRFNEPHKWNDVVTDVRLALNSWYRNREKERDKSAAA